MVVLSSHIYLVLVGLYVTYIIVTKEADKIIMHICLLKTLSKLYHWAISYLFYAGPLFSWPGLFSLVGFLFSYFLNSLFESGRKGMRACEQSSITLIVRDPYIDLQARRWQIFYGTVFELMTGHQADLTAQVSIWVTFTITSESETPECKRDRMHAMSFVLLISEHRGKYIRLSLDHEIDNFFSFFQQ